MIWFFFFLSASVLAQTPELNAPPPEVVPSVVPTATPGKASSDSSEYEVDYEEEPGSEELSEPEEEPVPVPVKTKRGKSSGKGGESQPQGSRAEKKITPLLKSETKSKYRKNGRNLDVDPD